MLLKLLISGLFWLRRKVGLYGIACLTLLYAGVFVVLSSLSNLVRGLDDEVNWLGQITFAAICFGWWRGSPKRNGWLNGWLTGFASVILGLFVVFEHVGNLWPSMIAVFRSAIYLVWSLINETLPGLPALISLSLSWNEWMGALSSVFTPVRNWLYGITVGEFVFNPVVTLVLWSSIVGYMACWAGWSLRRLGRPLLALLPAGLLLAVSFSYVRQSETLALALFAGIALLLIGLTHQYTQEQEWRQRQVDYAEDLRLDALVSSGTISVGVVLVAVLLPIINIRQIIDFFTTPPAVGSSVQSAEVGESLGLAIPEPSKNPFQRQADAGGLPRMHLLGTGPELSEQVVMIVEVDDPAASSQRYYWRSLTYDTYTGWGWLTGETTSIPYSEGVNAFPPTSQPQRMIRQHVRLTEDVGEFVFSAGDILTLDWPYSIAWRTPPDGEQRRDQFAGMVDQDDYQVDSILPLVIPSQLRAIRTPLPDWIREKYLSLPEGIPSRVFDIAAEVTIAQSTPYDRAIAIERFLRSFTYSLDLPQPPLDQDIVDYFLFDLKRGYCDYFATAMVVMARASGLPARLAVGYASGEYDPANDRYVVTAAQAHSWAEVYFEGVGWVPFEPTGNQPEMVRTETQAEFANSVVTPSAPFEPVWVRTARQVGWSIAGLILLGVLALFGWNLWDLWRFRHLSPDEMVARLFSRLYPAGERLGVDVQAGATPYEFASVFTSRVSELSVRQRIFYMAEEKTKLLSREIRWLTETFVRAAYAPEPLTDAERLQALKLWRGMRVRLWQARVHAYFQHLVARFMSRRKA